MFLTARQKEILEAQRHHKHWGGPIPKDVLGVTQSSIDATNTHIFNNFIEALVVMTEEEYEAIFDGRLKKHGRQVWEATRKLRKRMTELEA